MRPQPIYQKEVNFIFLTTLVFIIILFFTSGCHTVKYDWFPEEKPNAYKKNKPYSPPIFRDEDLQPVKVNVVKVSF
tara:strand:+ start:592 stop:819 length:228 start_codon:yes stop_codon:yes gene_type:complete